MRRAIQNPQDRKAQKRASFVIGTMHVRVEGNWTHSLQKLGVLLCMSKARTQQHALWQCVGIWDHSPNALVTKQTRYPSETHMPLCSSDKVSKYHIRLIRNNPEHH